MSDTPQTDEAVFGTDHISVGFARLLERERNDARRLLRAAYDLLKRAEQSRYVLDVASIPVRIGTANCDGECLMEDIATALDLDVGTEPIPLEPEANYEHKETQKKQS